MSQRITRRDLRSMIMNEVRRLTEAQKPDKVEMSLQAAAGLTLAKALDIDYSTELGYYTYHMILDGTVGEDSNTVKVSNFRISKFNANNPLPPEPYQQKAVDKEFARPESSFQRRLSSLLQRGKIEPGAYRVKVGKGRRLGDGKGSK